jgi:periplasmic copper chaperone A
LAKASPGVEGASKNCCCHRFVTEFLHASGMKNRTARVTSSWLAASTAALFLIPTTLPSSASAHEYYADGFTIVHPWALPTAPGVNAAEVYLRFDDISSDDRLVSAKSLIAASVVIIESVPTDAPPKEGNSPTVALRSGVATELSPGGTRLVMRDLSMPLQADRSYPLTLVFERAGTIMTTVSIGNH